MAKKFLLINFAILCFAFLQAGCVTYQSVEPLPVIARPAIPPSYALPVPVGVYHQVESGQTLWAISRNYGVDVTKLMKYNSIRKPQELVVRERIFIPSSGSRLPVEPLYVSRAIRWRYIIIHHSATDVGSAESFEKGHLSRGFYRGLGYHFVIDNGSKATKAGDIEVSRRWFYQMAGAHCNAAGMNEKAIGICLVGNFDEERVTKKQFDSLVALVDHLRLLYNIPIYNIKGHKDVSGATTRCPGSNFPSAKLKKELSRREFAYRK